MARLTKTTINKAQADERRAIKARRKTAETAIDAKSVDAYQNFAQSVGIGTQNALSASTYGFNPITRVRTLLEWIYRGSWIGGVAVDIVAEDMTRSGIEILSTMPPEDIEKIQQGLVRFGIWGGLCDTVKWARLYGGCIGVLQIDGQDVSTPLNIERVGPGAFKGIIPLDRWMVEADVNDLVTDLGPELGSPKFYRVTTDAPAFRGKRIHYSRVIRVLGIKLPYWQSVMENLWGLSVYERLYDRMVAFDSATMGMAQNVFRSYLRHYKVKDFTKIMAAGGIGKSQMLARVNFMRMTQGNEGITLIDAEDDMVGLANSSFVGIGDAILKLAEQLSGCLQIPLTRLFGQSPGGLNSTGVSDERNYDSGILQKQEMDLREGLTKIVRVVSQSERIKIPDNFSFAFNKLTQLTEEQKSQVAQRDSQTIAELLTDGIISMQTALKELRQLSRATGRMSNITDEQIEAADELPPPKPDPMALAAAAAGAGGEKGGASEGGSNERGLEPRALKGAEDRATTDPPVSPAQKRLMEAAAHTPGGYGGVPQAVGKEFVGKDAAGEAAGTIYVTPAGRVLWLRRSGFGDRPGVWDFPGGNVEGVETPEMAASRETNEEIGYVPEGRSVRFYRAISENGIDYTTFLHPVAGEFQVSLNGEHDAWAWSSFDDPPQPVHPAIADLIERVAVLKIAGDEGWEESKHPRNESGEFTGGASAAKSKVFIDPALPKARQKYLKSIGEQSLSSAASNYVAESHVDVAGLSRTLNEWFQAHGFKVSSQAAGTGSQYLHVYNSSEAYQIRLSTHAHGIKSENMERSWGEEKENWVRYDIDTSSPKTIKNQLLSLERGIFGAA